MRLLCYIISISLLLQLPASRCSAQYYFKHYQGDEGLAHNSVTSIIQDNKGLIWIGTRGGLNRFDGYNFVTYKNKKNRFGNIGNNIITAIAQDKKGMLWIGTGKGLYKYDPYKEIFTLLDKAPKSYISHVLIDSEDNLWFLANFSLHKYDQQSETVTGLKISASCIAIDQNKNLWLGNDDGVISIVTSQLKPVNKIRIISELVPANLRSISKIYPISKNDALIGCFKQGLKRFNPQTGAISSVALSNDKNAEIYVRDITAGDNKEYWIATESGIFIYDIIKNKSIHLQKRIGDPFSLGDNAVYTICKDKQGGIWAGTFFSGVNYYSKDNARFEKYYPLQGANSISGDAVREIISDKKGNLWIGTEDAGLNKLDLKTGKFTTFSASGKKGAISYPNIHGLLALGNQLFIGPFYHGMEVMDLRTGLVTDRFKLIGNENGRASDFVLCIYLTKDSTLLVGTAYHGSGLFVYNRQLKTFSRIKQIPYNSYVFDIKEDAQGNIWTGSVSQGAFYYNPKTGHHGNVRFGDKINGKYINEFAIHNILEDSNHCLWFATDGGGLVKLSPDLKTIKKFTTENGLPSNVILSILEDNSKHLWISSLKGLICFDLITEKSKTYTQSNGLITDQFNYNSAYKDSAGKMYFGSVKGMIAFSPSQFEAEEVPPPTYITGFQINNKEIAPDDKNGPLSKSILFTDTIVLAHDQNNFSIEFAALNYSSPKVTRYKYFMKGLDKDWTYLNSNRNAYFTDLAPGYYTFIVSAESNIGNWRGKERHLFIKILPPIWKSVPAYCIYLCLLAIILYLSVRYYHRYLERKNQNKLQLFEHEKKKEIYEAKIEFFTNIAHEIQTPLTLIVGPVEWLIKKTEEQPGIKKSLLMVDKNAKRLAELTNQLLDFRKTEMHQFGLNFVNADITSLLEELITGFVQEAQKNNIDLRLELPDDHLIAFVDREALVKICSNLVSNAIKYASTKAIISLTTFNTADETFTIRFSNDGKTIPPDFRERVFEPFFRMRGNDKPGTGIGLSLAKSLTHLHNGSLKIVTDDTDLTVFELLLPVHQEIEFRLGSWKKIE